MDYENLRSHWYYRLLKVIYIIAFLFVLIFFVFLIYQNYTPSLAYYYFKCDNGRELKYPEIPMEYTRMGISLPNIKEIGKICNGGYKQIYVYEERDWKNTILYSFLAIALLFFVSEIIKGIFFYVAIGKWRAFKFRRKK